MMTDEQRWDRAASNWVEYVRGSDSTAWFARRYVLLPVVLDLVGAVKGQSVLDVGCGEGEIARLLAARGARVRAIDHSAMMIAAAETGEAVTGEPISFEIGRMEHLDVEDESQDVVVSSLSLNLVEDYRAVIGEFARVLRTGGSAIVVLPHPCFDDVGPGMIRRDGGARYSENRYLETVEGMSVSGARTFHRPISAYVQPLADAGLSIRRFVEPSIPEVASRMFPEEHRRYDQIPMILALEAVKG